MLSKPLLSYSPRPYSVCHSLETSFKSPLLLNGSRSSAPSKSGQKNSTCSFRASPSQKFSSAYLQHPSPWNASEIAQAVDGEVIKWGLTGTISTDTRNLTPGQWFFAIVGQKFDGHNFINSELEEKGCVGVIGNRVGKNWQRGFIKVEGDTLVALQKMAYFARKRFHGYVVGLTGSAGKTTTRNMISLALESIGEVYQTYGNQNNQIGVAFSLIGIPLNAKVVVLELGMSLKGEILELASMCCPSIRVILNVGPSHMENFESLQEVSRAKGELLTEAKPGDICVLNGDDPMVMTIPVPDRVKKVLFGRKTGCDVQLVEAESIDGGSSVRLILKHQSHRVEFKIHGPGLHQAVNACAACAVAVSLGVSLPQVGESLSKFRPVDMRSKLEIANCGCKIINDSYNANPMSMAAAISSLEGMSCRNKRVAILGDMLELGLSEAKSHEDVLYMCCSKSQCFGLIVLVGKRFLAAIETSNLWEKINMIWALDSDSVAREIVKWVTADDVILVKGSRGMKMEKVVDAIKAI